MPKFGDFNNVKVTAELLGDVMAMYAELPASERVFERRARRVLDLLAISGHGPNRGLLAMALMIRLMALDALLQGTDMKGWTSPGSGAGTTYVHADLLQAAADVPLMEGWRGRPVFNGQRFRQRVLQLAAARGRA